MRIDPEFQALIPPLTEDERAGLEASIAAEGCRDPLVVWCEADTLVDGHNRLEICQRLGKPYSTTGLSFPDRPAALAWVIRNQFSRRNLNAWQKAELALALQAALRPAAESRMLAGKSDPFQNSGKGLHVDREIAKAAGISHDTVYRARLIQEKAPPSVVEALRRGEVSTNEAFKNLGVRDRNSSKSEEYYTPAIYIEAARRVLGTIDLDPASCEEANRTVRATRYYDRNTDGLTQEWHGRVWMNPPYCGKAADFLNKLLAEHKAGRTTAAIIALVSRGICDHWFHPLLDFPICIPKGRINFYGQGALDGTVFAYLGPDADRFAQVFEQFGPVVHRMRNCGDAREPIAGHAFPALDSMPPLA